MRNVTFSGHAEDQIAERKLPRQQVIETVLNAEEVLPSGSRLVAQAIIKGDAGKRYLIRVVYEEHDGTLEVITAYRTSKINKYRSAQ